MLQRINVIALGAENVEHAARFYERLGWQRTDIKSSPEYSHIQAVFFRLNGDDDNKSNDIFLGLIPMDAMEEEAGLKKDDDPHKSGKTLEYNVASKDEVREVIRIAREAGATITCEPTDRKWGGYSAYFKDLDGHLWGIVWNPHPLLP